MTRFKGSGPLAITALTFALAGADPAGAGQRIVNGLDTHGFPTTGALLYSGGSTITATNASTQCSGTLIGCQTFLTAAHCVEGDTAASHYWVYLQNSGIHQVSSITYHPAYNGNSGRDVAIVKLTSQVAGIVPTTVNSTHDLDAMGIGLDGTIAGFGRTGGGSDYGIKRYGAVVTADCDTSATGGEGNDVLVCWDYDSSVGPAGDDSNTCNGDSGGPLFMDFAGTVELVGITSAGVTTNCLAVDHSWDASVYYNAAWIDAQLGADSTDACGGLAPVGHPDVTTFHNSGALSLLQPSDSFTVNLTGSASVVRFTLNGTDNGSFNPNFFVQEGTGASAAQFDCKADGATVFGACEFVNPSAGTWSVFVERASGSGQYQITTTVFGGDPPVCGNNLVEFGEECDGASDAACAGLCTSCSCAVTCSTGPLYGVKIVSDERRLNYKAWLFDGVGAYAGLDPRDDNFTLSFTDGSGLIDLAIPAADSGWVKADPLRGRFMWEGDGVLDGLRRVKLTYRNTSAGAFWILIVKGSEVTGGATVQVVNELDFELGFDGTCHLETW